MTLRYCLAGMVILAALGVSKPAAALYVTGADLLESCVSEKPEQINACIYYIIGVIDYHIMMQSLGTTPTIDFCLPEYVTKRDAASVVISYLNRSPQHADFIAAPVVVMALHDKFPCRKPVKKPKRKK